MPGPARGSDLIRARSSVRTLLLTSGDLTAITFDEATKKSQHLSGGSAAVWALLDRPSTIDEIVDELVNTFAFDRVTSASTVQRAIEDLRWSGLLVDAETPDADSYRDAGPEPREIVTLSREPDP